MDGRGERDFFDRLMAVHDDVMLRFGSQSRAAKTLLFSRLRLFLVGG